jgi:hypothetical protein
LTNAAVTLGGAYLLSNSTALSTGLKSAYNAMGVGGEGSGEGGVGYGAASMGVGGEGSVEGLASYGAAEAGGAAIGIGGEGTTAAIAGLASYGAAEAGGAAVAGEAAAAGYGALAEGGVMEFMPELVTAAAAWVLCSELVNQGKLEASIVDDEWSYIQKIITPEEYQGYRIIADPMVKLMQKSKVFTNMAAPFIRGFAYEMASRVNLKIKGSKLGKFVLWVGLPLCRICAPISTRMEVRHGL